MPCALTACARLTSAVLCLRRLIIKDCSPMRRLPLRHVRASSEKRTAEEIANRIVCEDFDSFKPLFERVQRELKSGIRQALPVDRMDEIKLSEIQPGQFFIVGGQIAYVAEVGQDFKTEYDRRDSRLRVIYDNGTESNLLARFFQRSLLWGACVQLFEFRAQSGVTGQN